MDSLELTRLQRDTESVSDLRRMLRLAGSLTSICGEAMHGKITIWT